MSDKRLKEAVDGLIEQDEGPERSEQSRKQAMDRQKEWDTAFKQQVGKRYTPDQVRTLLVQLMVALEGTDWMEQGDEATKSFYDTVRNFRRGIVGKE